MFGKASCRPERTASCVIPTRLQSTVPPKLAFTVDETANALSIGRTKLYGLVKAGKIRACKIGRKTLFLASDVRAFINHLQKSGVA